MGNNEQVDAIVIGCNYANVLGMVKSVGEAGYRCGLIHCTSILNKKNIIPDMASRHVVKGRYALRHNDAALYEALVKDFRQEGSRPVLLSADDYSASFLDRFYDKLTPYFRLLQWKSGKGMLTYYTDKEHQSEAASRNGFPVAKGWSVTIPEAGEAPCLPDDMIFPCITKPEVSAGQGMSKALISVCQTKEELEQYFAQIAEDGAKGTILVEEFLTIEEEYTIPGIRLDDEVIIPSYVRKLETGTGKVRGLTVLGKVESTDSYPQLKKDIERFIFDIGLVGIFDVEIIKCKGKYYFNEINLRSSAATYAVTGSGVNIPKLYIDYLLGKDWKKNNLTVKTNTTFLNEKPALQCFAQKDYSLLKYLWLCKRADINLLTGTDDEPATKAFRIKEEKEIIKRAMGPLWNVYMFVKRMDRFAKRKLRKHRRRFVNYTGKLSDRISHAFEWRIRKVIRLMMKLPLVSITEVKDDATLPEISMFLERVFQFTMQEEDVVFSNASDFVESLKEVKVSGGKTFVATFRGTLLGTVSLKPVELNEWYHTGTAIRLKHLAVDPKCQKFGIGGMLVNKVLDVAAKTGNIVVLGTPEKNKNAIRFYTKMGFQRTRFFISQDHYAIRLVHWNGQEGPDKKTCESVYRNSALYSLMKHWELTDTIAEESLQKQWTNDFLPFLLYADKDVEADMRKAFRRYGAMPKDYVLYDFKKKKKAEKETYLTGEKVCVLSSLKGKREEKTILDNRLMQYETFRDYYRREAQPITDWPSFAVFVNTHDTCLVSPISRNSRKSSYTITAGTNRLLLEDRFLRKNWENGFMVEELPTETEPLVGNTLRFVTYRTGEKGDILFSLLTRGDGAFAVVEPADGKVSARWCVEEWDPILLKRQAASQEDAFALPDWNQVVEMVSDAMTRVDESLLGWDFVYTNKGWSLSNVVRNPSFRQIQMASDTGLQPMVEAVIGEPLTLNMKVK